MSGRPVPLRRLVERLSRDGLLRAPEQDGRGGSDLMIADLTTDSRAVRAGSLFCAIRGTAGDGHDFITAAHQKGAVAATVEHPVAGADLTQIVVSDGRLAAASCAAEFFGDPWREMTLVGITGTNGKTTTAAILRHLLARRGPAASVGTLGVAGADGLVVPGTEGLTTPGPVEVARWLRRLRDEGVEAVAMEVSSHALDQRRVAAVRFDAALFTNLTRDHLDYHGTLEAYRAVKLRLLDLLAPGAAAVVNADDSAWADLDRAGERIVRFGVSAADAEIRAEDVRLGAGGMRWTLATPERRVPVELPLFGAYNVSNALGAAAVLWSLGWAAGEIAEGLGTLPQVPGRLEQAAGPPDAPTTLIDYAHTPDALERALRAVRPLTPGRLIVVFGAGGDRDRGKRPEMGRVAAALADLSIVTSDNPRGEDPARIADEIEAGMGDARRLRVIDRREAIRHALEEATPRDVVLLAGKGHETYQIRGAETVPFDERQIVAEILDSDGSHGQRG